MASRSAWEDNLKGKLACAPGAGRNVGKRFGYALENYSTAGRRRGCHPAPPGHTARHVCRLGTPKARPEPGPARRVPVCSHHLADGPSPSQRNELMGRNLAAHTSESHGCWSVDPRRPCRRARGPKQGDIASPGPTSPGRTQRPRAQGFVPRVPPAYPAGRGAGRRTVCVHGVGAAGLAAAAGAKTRPRPTPRVPRPDPG